MKFMLTAVLFVGTMIHLSAQTPAVTFIGHEKVAEALAKGGGLVTASNLTVSGNHRAMPGQVEVHDKETDILYIQEGQATLVTGGAEAGSGSPASLRRCATARRRGPPRHHAAVCVLGVRRGVG